MFSSIAARNVLRSKLGLKRTLEDAAADIEVVEAATHEAADPLHVLPGQLDRVTSGIPGASSAQGELGIATTNQFFHAPVIRYVLKDCLVHAAGVEYAGGHYAKTRGLRTRLLATPEREVGAAAYCMSNVSHRYFGHWVRDACATALLPAPEVSSILDVRPDWGDAAPYMAALQLNALPAATLWVNELQIYSDFAQGRSKRARYDMMKNRLRQATAVPDDRPRPIYLRRGTTGVSRLIANEDRLCEALSARGFDILDLTGRSFSERYRALSCASAIVTIDGSHMAHAHFAMKSGGALLTLVPSDRFTMIHRGLTQAMGNRFGCVVLEASPMGYVVEVDEVLRTLDMMT